jgi:hypothetical protein
MFPLFRLFRRRLTIKHKIKNALRGIPDRLRRLVKALAGTRYYFYSIPHKLRKLKRSTLYAAEDTGREMKKMSRHTEAFLFGAIIVLGVIMLFSAGNADFINSLIALLLLVLVVVIYMQLKFQKRMLDQYVPTIDYVRIGRCQLYSDRVRVINLYGALEKMDRIKNVRNIKIKYDIVNDSFSPVSIQAASLTVGLKKGGRIRLPSSMSILDVEPKRTSGVEVGFRLPKEVAFDSIAWLELSIIGNCKKSVRIKPHLYVNIVVRGKKPEFIIEPFATFRKRPEIAKG